jgi:hypothetical protein
VTPARDGDVWKGIADGKQLIIEQLNAELDLARAEVAHWRECATFQMRKAFENGGAALDLHVQIAERDAQIAALQAEIEILNESVVEDIIYGRRLPMESAYLAGRRAHSAGEPFSNWPPPFGGPEALSWRFGWNDHALGRLSMFPETPS